MVARKKLFSKTTEALIYGHSQLLTQQMLDFDFLCGRKRPSVAGIIRPKCVGFERAFFGQKEFTIPVHSSIEAACAAHPTADVFINFSYFTGIADSSMAALKQPTIRVLVIMAKVVPELDTMNLIAYATEKNKVVVGPSSTVGGIQAGAFIFGDAVRPMDDIIQCKLYRPGSIGLVSKSGDLSVTLFNKIASLTNGIYEGIATGGPTLSDHIMRISNIPQVKMIVVLGVLDWQDANSIFEAVNQRNVTKPVVMLVKSVDHTVAESDGGVSEPATLVESRLKENGIFATTENRTFESLIRRTFEKLKAEGKIRHVNEVGPLQIPEDLTNVIMSVKARSPTHVIPNRGEEPCYAGESVSVLMKGYFNAQDQYYGVGDSICLLWFKRRLSVVCSKCIEICIMLLADCSYSPVIRAKYEKELLVRVVSDLLKIGLENGVIIATVAKFIKYACDRGISPSDFVLFMKSKGFPVSTIGRMLEGEGNTVKSVRAFARKCFPSVKYMDYVGKVEAYSLSKSNDLVINEEVGTAVSFFLDILTCSGKFSEHEMDEIVKSSCLNGFYVLAHTICMIRGDDRVGGVDDCLQIRQLLQCCVKTAINISSEPMPHHCGLGYAICLLWFKRNITMPLASFIEMCIMIFADDGTCVSGANNSIVVAREGLPGFALVSSLASGLLAIADQFSGSIDDVVRYFKRGCDEKLTPEQFVQSINKGLGVPGIGHRIERGNMGKRIKRGVVKDERVKTLIEYARRSLTSLKYLPYAVEVETYTLSLSDDLVLNVEGAVGCIFLDFLSNSMTKQEMDEIVDIGYMSRLILVARSIGLIGHGLSQMMSRPL